MAGPGLVEAHPATGILGCTELCHLPKSFFGGAMRASFSLEGLIYNQVRGSTKGFQDEGASWRCVEAAAKLLHSMNEGEEEAHLKWLLRHACR